MRWHEFRTSLNLALSDTERSERLNAAGEGVEIIEVVVKDTSRLVDRTAEAVGLAWRQSAVLMGISRGDTRIKNQVRKTPIKPGDILLLLVPRNRGHDVTDWLGCLPLADRGLAVTENSKV